jgi:Pyruvate/2-oxoacid:ferredoxin oxidoreductase delta subunit
MQGNGPGSGELVDVGLLIVSDDPVAADAVGCRIMGIDPLSVPQVRIAHENGLGNAHPECIDLRGENIEQYIKRGFSFPPRIPALRLPPFLLRLGRDLLVPRPVIDAALCTKCGECVASCPAIPKALAQEPECVPTHDYASCIRCSCCQEGCRFGAISLKDAPLGPRTRRSRAVFRS